MSQCILYYLSSCQPSTLEAWRKGSHGKSIRNILILLFSVMWKQKSNILFPQMSSGMSCSIWAPSTGRDENHEGKEWGSPRHLVYVLYRKSKKQCKKSLTEPYSLPEKQWEINKLLPTFTSYDIYNMQWMRRLSKLNAPVSMRRASWGH